MKHVVIDARCVGAIPHGMHVFVSSIAMGLEQLGKLPYQVTFLVAQENSEPIFSNPTGFRTQLAQSSFLHPLEMIEIPSLLRKLGADLYHSPTFSSLPYVGRPWIVTVHDLNHLHFGSVAQRLYYRALLRPFVRGAAGVCTVSEFSRREIAEWTDLDQSRLWVTYNAVRAGDYQVSRDPEPRFFCLTNPKPHKNTEFLRKAYARYRESCRSQGIEPWKLQLTIPAPSGIEEPGIQYLSALASEKVAELRASAGAVVFPSLYEGFGLPPVEAAIEGILPLVSRIAPHEEGLSELSADEVGWFDPRDEVACAKALLNATLGRYGRPSRESAIRIRERFSAEQLGRQMDQIYRGVLGL